jgi:excisionase family DNA binding protein
MSTTLVQKVASKYYRFKDASERLNISNVTLWRWIREGKLLAESLGREVLIEKKVVEALRK